MRKSSFSLYFYLRAAEVEVHGVALPLHHASGSGQNVVDVSPQLHYQPLLVYSA